MKYIHIAIIILFSYENIFSSQAIELGQIILLNGTSSAGKSSIAKELKNICGPSLKIVSIDEYARDIFGAKYDKKMWEDFYIHNKNLSKAGYTVVIDTLKFEDDYEKYCSILSTNIRKILIYCPLANIAEHIEQRNQSKNKRDHRSLIEAYYQFLNLYGPKKSNSDTFVDSTNNVQMYNTLQEIITNIEVKRNCMRTKSSSTDLDLMQKFIEKFNLNENHTHTDNETDQLILTQEHSWDLVINTNDDSANTAAQKIIDFMNIYDKN